jgi:hypothetical protein
MEDLTISAEKPHSIARLNAGRLSLEIEFAAYNHCGAAYARARRPLIVSDLRSAPILPNVLFARLPPLGTS